MRSRIRAAKTLIKIYGLIAVGVAYYVIQNRMQKGNASS